MEIIEQKLFDDSEALTPVNRVEKAPAPEDDYLAFLDKFKAKKTTDDCYTPNEVYEVVVDFVNSIYPLDGKPIIRPFFPGSDYQSYSYAKDGVVIDNPPFSLMTQIVKFYDAHKIPFFLFAPTLTLMTTGIAKCNVCFVVCGGNITYANGAKVATSFVTNLIPDLKVWVCPELQNAISNAQKTESKAKAKAQFPANITTAAVIRRLSEQNVGFKISKASCRPISSVLDSNGTKYSLFGGGLIMSTKTAKDLEFAHSLADKNIVEKAKALADKRAKESIKLKLSENEMKIIAELDNQEPYHVLPSSCVYTTNCPD